MFVSNWFRNNKKISIFCFCLLLLFINSFVRVFSCNFRFGDFCCVAGYWMGEFFFYFLVFWCFADNNLFFLVLLNLSNWEYFWWSFVIFTWEILTRFCGIFNKNKRIRKLKLFSLKSDSIFWIFFSIIIINFPQFFLSLKKVIKSKSMRKYSRTMTSQIMSHENKQPKIKTFSIFF